MSSINNMSSMNSNASPSKPRIPVGMVYVQNPGPWWVPPGLESTQGPGAKPINYRSPFFGADREYGENEGWQIYMNRHQRRNARRRNRVADDNEYNFDDDAY